MVSALLGAALSIGCPNTELINKTKWPWNGADTKNMYFAANQCQKMYPDKPCLAIFVKLHKADYDVYCGPKEISKHNTREYNDL